jgi:hypothetical protein
MDFRVLHLASCDLGLHGVDEAPNIRLAKKTNLIHKVQQLSNNAMKVENKVLLINFGWIPNEVTEPTKRDVVLAMKMVTFDTARGDFVSATVTFLQIFCSIVSLPPGFGGVVIVSTTGGQAHPQSGQQSN